MTDAVILWWILSALSVFFLVLDWSHAPIDATMHVAFLLVTAFMGPLGAIIYVLTVREPLPGTHPAYIAPLWKQVVGSTLHCVAGDSVGIVGAAVVTSFIPAIKGALLANLAVEYVAGFLVGWTIFQAFFMKDMAGGNYVGALKKMFLPEWLSMNGVMAGMIIVMVPWMRLDPGASHPEHPLFWFMMSMALIAGALVAYPINWWLVAAKLKHGLMSTAPKAHEKPHSRSASMESMSHDMHHMPDSNTASPNLLPIVLWSTGTVVAALIATMGL